VTTFYESVKRGGEMKGAVGFATAPFFFFFREMPRHRIELWTRGFSDKNPEFPNLLKTFNYLKSLNFGFHTFSDFFQF
jgi:hypothetical protein